MNRFALIIIATFGLAISLFANTNPTEPHTTHPASHMNVVAHSGLSMRTGPASHHDLITVIPYGSSVEILHTDSIHVSDRIEWVSGEWTLVKYKDYTGYVFDGFLSKLHLPVHDFEKTSSDLDLIYPLQSWVETHMMAENHVDTITTDYYDKVTQHFVEGHTMERINAGNLYKLRVTLDNVRIMDAYHLLKTMLNNKYEVEYFNKKSIFITSAENELHQVKVDLDNPVDIRKNELGQVVLTITSQEYECKLL